MDYNFRVETVEAGQRKSYGDSYYSYIVEDLTDIGLQEYQMKQFCTGFLKPAKYSYGEWLIAQKKVVEHLFTFQTTILSLKR